MGDGGQTKSYLLVDECIEAILSCIDLAKERVNIFNLGNNDQINVIRIGELVVEEMGLSDVKFTFTGGPRGWIGDVPIMLLDTSKVNKLGWKSKVRSEDAVRQAIKYILETN